MTILTLTQAAKVARVARSTLYRAIRKGRISVVSQPNGSKGIDTAELIRVFGPLQVSAEQSKQSNTYQDAALLRAHIDALERENTLLRDEVQASRERESKLLDVVSRGLLEGPKNRRRKDKRKSCKK